MDFYRNSSQFRHWIFNKAELESIRNELNKNSVEHIKKALVKEAELGIANEKDRQIEIDRINRINWITAEEQRELCHFYETKIIVYCQFFKFDPAVQWTALMLFKKFYVKATIMDYNLKYVVPTCVFMAAKSENGLFSLDRFVQQIPKAPPTAVILDLELVISTLIDFEYFTWHISWSLKGFILRYELFAKDKNSFSTKLQHQIDQSTASMMRICYLTDLPLLYASGTLGLGILVTVLDDIRDNFNLGSSKLFVEAVLDEQKKRHLSKIVDLPSHLADIKQTLKAYKPPDNENLKKLSLRLQECETPEFKPTSFSFKQKQQNQFKQVEQRKLKQQQHKMQLELEVNHVSKKLKSDADVFL